MELDDLKQAFHAVDKRLARHEALAIATRKEQGFRRVRASLRPLVVGHAAQLAVGVLVAVFAGRLWVEHLDEPHLLVAGLVVHVYAVLMIVLGAQVLAALYRLDWSAPVVVIQKQLAWARRSYVRTGLVVGLPWWLLWIPFGMLLLASGGVDIYADLSRAWLAANLAIGIIGIGGTLWFTRALWRKPPSDELASDAERRMAGTGLQSAQRLLDEIAEFEKES
jgi:hypothetical protein